jgi:methylated-DNA-[protein]-cysteine S-methyltransferase
MKKTIIESTRFGSVAVLWSFIRGRPVLARVILSQPGLSAEGRVSDRFPEAAASTCPAIAAICSDIAASLNGQRIRFSLRLAQLDLCPSFQQAVLRAEHGIPCGSVSTYRLLAIHLRKPRAARSVGNALANNPFPIIVPCHRAIRSDRSLGGYQGGLAMKRALLESEGIQFDTKGRVQLARLHYETDRKR